ncbi:hypothetical protein AGOR_G00194830 [Albula goreensis]|uniref:Uncharacterized protein n=1 Tax=Albula goreensis TaxID=1534307 RepID=A0A8T3CZN0_9TELE|nr:hypothetical protein AGOR_G00194830 [Albula goreensis]
MRRIYPVLILCLTGLDFSSAQSVRLYGVIGWELTFPSAVRNNGTLMYGTTVICSIRDKKRITYLSNNLKDRLQWNSNTGFFSITRLEQPDAGVYKVIYEGGSVMYNLTIVNMHPQISVLNGTERDTITFSTKVKKGNLKYGTETIVDVQNDNITVSNQRFTGRVKWDSSTGFFSITGLKKEDSGVYIVQNDDEEQQQPDHIYQLSVTGGAALPALSLEDSDPSHL